MIRKSQNSTTFFRRLLAPYKYMAFAIVFFHVLASGFDGISIGMLVPLLSSMQGAQPGDNAPAAINTISQFLTGFDLQQQILFAVAMVVVALILKNVTHAIAFRFGIWLATRLSADLKERAMQMLLTAELGFHRKSKVGDLMERAIHSPNQVESLVQLMVESMANIATFFVLLCLMFILSWQLTISSIVLGLGYMSFISAYLNRVSKPSKERAQIDLRLSSKVQESFAGIELIKSCTRERSVLAAARALIERSRMLGMHIAFRARMVNWITDILGGVALGALFVISMFLYDLNTDILIARLLPFLYIITRLVPILRMINGARAIIVTQWPRLQLTQELFETASQQVLPNGHHEFEGLKQEIRFEAVSFSYEKTSNLALNQASFCIPKGFTTALIGQSGAGKSTVINLIMRFYDPQHGEIRVDGRSLRSLTRESWRNRIGVVSQDTFVFHDTVRNNIAFGLDGETEDELIVAAARKAGAHDFIMKLPQGYDTLLGDRGLKLSGGQRQRISIARAILRDPEILILDEATSSLDNLTERQIHNAISELSRNRTVIIIAHRLSTIKNADQIVVLKDGRVTEVGHESELRKDDGEYCRLAGVK